MDDKIQFIIHQVKNNYFSKEISIKKIHAIGNSKNLIIELRMNYLI
ncbi:MAG: hypothetical protein ABF289_20755 [Clostridiales bacterium]